MEHIYMRLEKLKLIRVKSKYCTIHHTAQVVRIETYSCPETL